MFENDVWDGFVEEWLDEQSTDRLNVIVQRALIEAKLEAVPEDEEGYDFLEKFKPAFESIATQMAFRDFYADMAAKGLVEPVVEGDGTLGYQITAKGHEAMNQEPVAS